MIALLFMLSAFSILTIAILIFSLFCFAPACKDHPACQPEPGTDVCAGTCGQRISGDTTAVGVRDPATGAITFYCRHCAAKLEIGGKRP